TPSLSGAAGSTMRSARPKAYGNQTPQPADWRPMKPEPKDHWYALTAGFLGWTLDAFDFFLVTFALTAIGKEFGQSDVAMGATIATTLAFRPVGALIFGLMADRWGRRTPLMIDLVFYSVVEVATGFTHSYTSFIILRALF